MTPSRISSARVIAASGQATASAAVLSGCTARIVRGRGIVLRGNSNQLVMAVIGRSRSFALDSDGNGTFPFDTTSARTLTVTLAYQ